MERSVIITLVLAIFGLILIITGISMQYITNWQVKSQVAGNLQLKEGSASFEAWVSPPVPVYMQFWVWNVTNPVEVVKGLEKPKLNQMGPYTYKEIRNKTAVEFLEGGRLVRFREKKFFVFDREMSAGTENDTFIGVNLPMLGLAEGLRYKLNAWQRHMAGSALGLAGAQLFYNKTIGEFLWGYEDSFFKYTKQLMIKFGYAQYAEQIPDVVGLFTGDKANGTEGGWWTIHTGQDDINRINEIQSWNGLTKVDYWNADYANMINGTDASGWHPFISREEELPIFSSDICRSLNTVYKKDVNIKGLDLYRFVVDPLAMADNETNPLNNAYCTPPGNCMAKGVLNVSVCTGGPIVLSLPHFNGADNRYLHGVEGMHPTEDMDTVLDIHPMMGTVLHAARRMQFNAYIQPNPILTDTLDMNATVFPIMWLNETAVVGDDTAQMLLTKLHRPLQLVNVASKASAIAGLALVVLVTLFTLGKFVNSQLGGKKQKSCNSGISIIRRPDCIMSEEGEYMIRENSCASHLSTQSAKPLLVPTVA